MRTAIVLGGTGLVGKELVKLLIQDDYFSKVKLILRRPSGLSSPKLEEHIVDFDRLDESASLLIGDVLFMAFGTTLKKAGGKDAQYKIDYHYQFQVARHAVGNGVMDCVLVSSLGADAKSSIFYSRMKGELDRDVAKLEFDRLVLLKPSILAGDREENRGGESFGIILGKALSWIPGIRKYRPIQSSIVAQAMLHSIKNPIDLPIVEYKADHLFSMK